KISKPSACNAVETILVHEAVAAEFIPRLEARLAGVEIVRDDASFGQEFLDLKVALRVVPSFEEAVRHIERHGSDHTETIVTRDVAAAQRFVDEVGSSTVLV